MKNNVAQWKYQEQGKMACTQEFIDFVCSRLSPAGEIAWRKMMGDYVIYVNGKCVITACDGVCYVRKHPAIELLMQDAGTGYPYKGAKECYVLDLEHMSVTLEAVRILQEVLPFPKRKAKKDK
ncbi:MAG: TfoX/Sxy family protein [Bacteroidales bacterium]|nr:TfoX/Sxy family protein [Bacteroidales bacterium]MCM1147396.1 TfoX/Sxy family protein [Bacteroidales bacterium]MCM1206067.1 TfoX/Sxy family protein [Bacillota bacterium]MCM1510102.1 TfoX/Sxy family protein [Clostridium sp.]